MDVFYSNNYIDTHHLFGSDTQSSDCVHSPLSFSSTERGGGGGGGGSTTTFSYSDEEVILASDRPKRRAGRTKFKETRHPVYRGVRKRNNDKWVCELREPNKKTRIWLGTFATPEMAARAHDVAALALRGRSATLNFADSVWRLPVPASLDPKDIRKAAAEAAKAFDNNNHQQQQQQQQHQHSEVEEVTSKKNQLEEEDHSPEKMFYIDEDAEFGMPRLLADMAEGLLLSPPSSFGKGFNWDDQMESNTEVSLWNYSL